jgi:hypothetical protein
VRGCGPRPKGTGGWWHPKPRARLSPRGAGPQRSDAEQEERDGEVQVVARLVVTIIKAPCQDDMAGLPYSIGCPVLGRYAQGRLRVPVH